MCGFPRRIINCRWVTLIDTFCSRWRSGSIIKGPKGTIAAIKFWRSILRSTQKKRSQCQSDDIEASRKRRSWNFIYESFLNAILPLSLLIRWLLSWSNRLCRYWIGDKWNQWFGFKRTFPRNKSQKNGPPDQLRTFSNYSGTHAL